MEEVDSTQIGKNLKIMRGEMTQADLAKAMRKRGYKWTQATVWTAEQGDRKLKLDEAKSLADILGGSLTDFFQSSIVSEKARFLSAAIRALIQTWSETAQSVEALEGVRSILSANVTDIRESDHEVATALEDDLAQADRALKLYTIDSSISRAERQKKRRQERAEAGLTESDLNHAWEKIASRNKEFQEAEIDAQMILEDRENADSSEG
ncbi:helix-turn-helix transcriptional regulator [Kocuria sp. HSID16901]|uniref:helix-turn-helix transcriptional regulator n=1 Tax=Kocuria sp. HSID16901 TaxID=2419505 RepID=UPI000AEA47BE|nr:helix-turn-helix transcriptional regulator [Kocuria sp. HSID16901]RUQ22765.1 XRE family transcriptional regulator [Kocuria sp. HSID16901]